MEDMETGVRENVSNKRSSFEFETDMLSKLPDTFLIDILSLLPTNNAVRSSSLSKSWRHLWRHVEIVEYPCIRSKESATRFDKFLLDFPHPIIRKFNVEILYDDFIPTQVDSWVNWGVEHGAESINFAIGGKRYLLPAVLFQCQSLVKLRLGYSDLIVPKTPFCCPLLKQLNLSNVELDIVGFKNIMGSCSSLEKLSLNRCKFRSFNKHCSKIEIHSTSLRCLRLWLCKHEDYTLVTNLPSLVKLSISMTIYDNGQEQRDALDDLSFVKELYVGDRCTRALSFKDLGLNTSSSVRHLWLEVLMMSEQSHAGMVKLISSYPNLHTLVIEFNFRYYKDSQTTYGINVIEDFFRRRVVCLRTVHIFGIAYWEVTMLLEGQNLEPGVRSSVASSMKIDVIRLLLAQVNDLQKLIINVASDVNSGVPESQVIGNMTKLLQKYKISSPLVETVVSAEVVNSAYWRYKNGRYSDRKRFQTY